MNIRRFARLLQILKPKDFNLYCDSMQTADASISEKMASMKLHSKTDGKDVKADSQSQFSFSDFLEMKDQYYAEMLGNDHMPNFDNMSKKYFETIQWILFYYYRGTSSWSYWYPYKFVPFVSDFAVVHETSFGLNKDGPVKPFTHLLAILPEHSRHLLPESYQPFVGSDLNNLVSGFYRIQF